MNRPEFEDCIREIIRLEIAGEMADAERDAATQIANLAEIYAGIGPDQVQIRGQIVTSQITHNDEEKEISLKVLLLNTQHNRVALAKLPSSMVTLIGREGEDENPDQLTLEGIE